MAVDGVTISNAAHAFKNSPGPMHLPDKYTWSKVLTSEDNSKSRLLFPGVTHGTFEDQYTHLKCMRLTNLNQHSPTFTIETFKKGFTLLAWLIAHCTHGSKKGPLSGL